MIEHTKYVYGEKPWRLNQGKPSEKQKIKKKNPLNHDSDKRSEKNQRQARACVTV
jgi:hypothetical protein